MSHGGYHAELAKAFADSPDRERRVIERTGMKLARDRY